MTSPTRQELDASLHEIRTDWRDGRALGRVYRTPTGSLEARLTADGARLHRIYGTPSPDVTVTWEDLATLARAFERWVSVREDWAAYEERGIPPTQSAAQVYWAPGREAAPRTVGYRSPFPEGRAGIQFSGTDELRPLPAPRPVADGIEAIATFWRREPGIGTPAGHQVGERWTLGEHQILDVRRLEARARAVDECFTWLARETRVPAELLALRTTASRTHTRPKEQ